MTSLLDISVDQDGVTIHVESDCAPVYPSSTAAPVHRRSSLGRPDREMTEAGRGRSVRRPPRRWPDPYVLVGVVVERHPICDLCHALYLVGLVGVGVCDGLGVLFLHRGLPLFEVRLGVRIVGHTLAVGGRPEKASAGAPVKREPRKRATLGTLFPPANAGFPVGDSRPLPNEIGSCWPRRQPSPPLDGWQPLSLAGPRADPLSARWYQRILMYPSVVVLGVVLSAPSRRRPDALRLRAGSDHRGLPLRLQVSQTTCGIGAISCAQIQYRILGLTVPNLSQVGSCLVLDWSARLPGRGRVVLTEHDPDELDMAREWLSGRYRSLSPRPDPSFG